jgi:dolichol-phosphate mannosyltransferase
VLTDNDISLAARPGVATVRLQPSVGQPPDLSVIVPTFNEAQNISLLMSRLSIALPDVHWEVIFVDDDSPDGTARTVRRLAAADSRVRCIRRVGRRGLAGACIEGILASSAFAVAVLDADLQHDETLLPRMLASLKQGTDLVIGTRFCGRWSGQ